MDFFRLSEERIKQAQENGEFDNLPGLGKPLPKDDLAGIPEELRMAYRLMRNAGYSPEEANLKQELMTIEDLIKHTKDETEKEGLKNQLTQKLLNYNQMLSKKRINTNSSVFKNYEQKIEKKFL
ncbi:DUF1992 domain-containing protein [Heyndrickxia acidicola]|uniref:DUF1992 domain-containing protein n=1 Tax=Heyndrickxia acidicola TaxID=209389 RepID=A0ABU6MCX1_9BACI|nr:DUF1992 domain-containing protein [Heyndrickxia acidicola]MED1202263.1 DUF1992 domain-containing protein [Heyndrickxia acidicola]